MLMYVLCVVRVLSFILALIAFVQASPAVVIQLVLSRAPFCCGWLSCGFCLLRFVDFATPNLLIPSCPLCLVYLSLL